MTVLSSCAPPVSLVSNPPPHPTIGAAYTIGPEDKIRLSLYGDSEFGGEYKVAPNGTVSLPLIGAVQASGKTIRDLRDEITTQLADGYYVDPRVTAEIAEFRPFYIFGEVNQPGNYSFVPTLTLGKAIAIAGGYTYRANTRTVSIQRAGSDQIYRVRVDQAFRIGPGDTVRILERYF